MSDKLYRINTESVTPEDVHRMLMDEWVVEVEYEADEMYEASIEVLNAWQQEGVNPTYHRRMKDEVRQRWPMLGEALDTMQAIEEDDRR